ncbi:MAG: glycoside hydrolase family 2 protein [Prevotellaceae bacterium]|jgi:beta-galactosidase/beta-glucuronidase|nr:glycoside hydrolase family 2 protein [Prevotellaceae bacterium]
MKKNLATILLVLCLSIAAFARERTKINLNGNWLFQIADDDRQTVNLPHTWNALDGQDGNDYLRAVGVYRKTLAWDDRFEGKRIYIEFLGANMQATCLVNGKSAGTHKGGYTAFRFDITDLLQRGDNTVEVQVDNRYSEEIAPLSADFTFFGGLYRAVHLIVVDPVHVDLLDSGANGLYLTTTDVSEKSAGLEIRATIVNTSDRPATVGLQAVVSSPTAFDAVRSTGQPVFGAADVTSGGKPIATLTEKVTIPANSAYTFKKQTTVDSPRLWNGKADPYRYRVDFTVSDNGMTLDEISDHVGFRYFSVTKDGGFFLNGTSYPLRGVNRHQDRKDRGNALTEKEQNEDFALIYEMGANAVRLAHYPHDPYFYDLCDRYGLVVWAEIPFVNNVGKAATFADVTKQQLSELIRQQYNRPSIVFWGLENEVAEKYDSVARPLIAALNELAHKEDPTRLTTQAINHDTGEGWASDLIARNHYPGWYSDNTMWQSLPRFNTVDRPLGISEYGAGGSINHHETTPKRPKHNGEWHPEEYQSFVHEQDLIAISQSPYLWGTFLWNMFDFAADNRHEGDRAGMNDKGLVTYDRKVKKDSYFLYKANWNVEPVVYIAGRRHTERKEATTSVTVYSNCDRVELFINGVSQGTIGRQDVLCGIFRWESVALNPGENSISAKGRNASGAEWNDDIQVLQVISD